MKITKLVLLFNYKKILLGFLIALISFVVSTQFETAFNILFKVFSVLIIINIIASIVASYLLYDKSDLYDVEMLNKIVDFKNIENAILIHASFDPLSQKIEEKFPSTKLTTCDIYGNRHEHESGIKVSKKVFPPNPKEIKINPSELPFEDNSQDIVLAVTAVHEILNHEKRVLFFKEAKRILKSDGKIILSEQFRDSVNFIFFNIGAFHFLSENQWKNAIYEAGLRIKENSKITPFANIITIVVS
ncbi:methyltransferase domain-containing protein [Epilithonimonas sp.]|uniref:methyltransferase domain-containing protein n=1 Tax=Epilithonimonas sp. TaxID=2894511 RepID=UPI0035B1F519